MIDNKLSQVNAFSFALNSVHFVITAVHPSAKISTIALFIGMVLFHGMGSAYAAPGEGRKAHISEQLVALDFRVPNFVPEVGYIPGEYLYISLPESLVVGALNEVLRTNEGTVKETKFQKFKISNLLSSLIYNEKFDSCGNRPNCIPSRSNKTWSGIRITGQWRGYFRELLGCGFGKCHYTDWHVTEGTFSIPLYFEVQNSELTLRTGGLTLNGTGWDSGLVEFIAGAVDVHNGIRGNVQNALSSYDGLNLRDFLITKAVNLAAENGFDPDQARQFVSNRFSSLRVYNGTVGPGAVGLNFEIR